MTSDELLHKHSAKVESVQQKIGRGDSQGVVQITKEGIKGVFNGVLSDFGDRMSSDGMSTLGTISFQQFKPTDLKASCDIFLVAIASSGTCYLIHALTHSLTHPSTHPPIHPPTRSLTHSLHGSYFRVWYMQFDICV